MDSVRLRTLESGADVKAWPTPLYTRYCITAVTTAKPLIPPLFMVTAMQRRPQWPRNVYEGDGMFLMRLRSTQGSSL